MICYQSEIQFALDVYIEAGVKVKGASSFIWWTTSFLYLETPRLLGNMKRLYPARNWMAVKRFRMKTALIFMKMGNAFLFAKINLYEVKRP